MKLETPQPEQAVKYCSRVLDKNIGISNQTDDDYEQLLFRAKAYYRKAKALIYIGTKESLEQAKTDLN